MGADKLKSAIGWKKTKYYKESLKGMVISLHRQLKQFYEKIAVMIQM